MEKNLKKFEQDMIEKYGWFCHIVFGDHFESPTGFNAHTHNLQEKFDHLDIQIIIPLDNEMIMSILHNIVENYIKEGVKLKEGEEYDKVIQFYKVTFFKTKENGREILRLILPDEQGYIQKNEPMEKNFALQYE